jgi:RNA polymerase sigma-70 factor (ECF subfamily)
MSNNTAPSEHSWEDSFPEEPTLEKLFKEYYARLVYFSFQLVGNKAAAEDIVQEAFITYWSQKAEIVVHNKAVKSFLYSTVKNASLNVIRHHKVVAKYKEKLNIEEAEEAIIMNTMIHSEVLAEIHKALESLPESCQKISRMGYLEGMKNHEIATALGISVNTVKTQKQRGIRLLRLKISLDSFILLILLVLEQRAS